MLTALGVLLGMLLALFVVARATISIWLPTVARRFENDPKNPGKFAATTKIGPNKFKFKMRGGKVVNGFMNIAGYKQKGCATAPEQFEIVALTTNEQPPKETMGVIDGIFFRHAGYRAFNPFSERIYTYEFPRTEEIMGSDGLLQVVGVTDTSDYFLLSEQTYSFSIIDADTGQHENVKVTLKGKVTFEIGNPYKAAFADKKWLQQAIAAIQVRGRNFVRARDFDTLLGEVGKECEELKDTIGLDLAKVGEQIEGGPGTETLFGVRVRRVLVETIDMTDTRAEASRTAKYTATREAEVVGIATEAEANRRKKLRNAEAEAEAGYIEKVARATQAQGAIGLKMLDQQTHIAMAKGAGTTILNVGESGGMIDPIDAAILEELKKGNARMTPKNSSNS